MVVSRRYHVIQDFLRTTKGEPPKVNHQKLILGLTKMAAIYQNRAPPKTELLHELRQQAKTISRRHPLALQIP